VAHNLWQKLFPEHAVALKNDVDFSVLDRSEANTVHAAF
jgi:hypothetical protein